MPAEWANWRIPVVGVEQVDERAVGVEQPGGLLGRPVEQPVALALRTGGRRGIGVRASVPFAARARAVLACRARTFRSRGLADGLRRAVRRAGRLRLLGGLGGRLGGRLGAGSGGHDRTSLIGPPRSGVRHLSRREVVGRRSRTRRVTTSNRRRSSARAGHGRRACAAGTQPYGSPRRQDHPGGNERSPVNPRPSTRRFHHRERPVQERPHRRRRRAPLRHRRPDPGHRLHPQHPRRAAVHPQRHRLRGRRGRHDRPGRAGDPLPLVRPPRPDRLRRWRRSSAGPSWARATTSRTSRRRSRSR